ncbi:hypothetical protein DGG96_15440 [Legionella qingyii]|uniref:Uncharacterized protein n=1 Tax=Legionella qingyii TaxID=2184757 RepID=A0A317TZ14_9GAMM|nr:hypothetical protein [Legionella qingyii]PWY54771.1 hypothetical protein DGG96_15440 [Legionella qingyii]RUR20845.1 hypothetical protein ELY20_14375 [Legionella qingyii]
MKNKFIYIVLSLIFALFITIIWLYQFGPLLTTNASVFLDTSFGMSLSEVQRALKKNNVELVDGTTFEHLKSTPERNIFWGKYQVPLFHDSEFKRTLWYMPSIEMYNSRVVAEFEFIEDKLTSIEIQIFPISDKNVVHIIDAITESLKSRYEFNDKKFNQWMKIIKNRYKTLKLSSNTTIDRSGAKRPIDLLADRPELNKNVKLAYNLILKNKLSRLNLWLNLSDQYNPIIKVSIFPTKTNKYKIKQREKNAFS